MFFFSRRHLFRKLSLIPFIFFLSKSNAQDNNIESDSSKKRNLSKEDDECSDTIEIPSSNILPKRLVEELIEQKKKIHFLMETPAVSFDLFLTCHDGSIDATSALKLAAASGKTIIFPSNGVYSVNENDIAFAPFTKFVGPDGGYATFIINSNKGNFGTFDLRNQNGEKGGKYKGGYFNVFRNLRFRYPGQIKDLTLSIDKPISYPPLFFGGGYSSRFECLDIGNAYIGFILGGKGLGSCSRIIVKDIIGAPIFLGLSIEQVRDIPTIQNINWNYNYLDMDERHSYGIKLKKWININATAYQFGRCDWALCINLFSFGYYKHFAIESTRYTGSADRIKFVGCFSDQCVHPLWIKDFENQLDFIACGFTGINRDTDIDSGSYLSTKSNNAVINFTNCTFNSYYLNIIVTEVDVNMFSCQLYNYGIGSKRTSPVSAITIAGDNVRINIVNTNVDASKGKYVRCFYDGGYSGCLLSITGCSSLTGSQYEIFRWDSSIDNSDYISQDSFISGAYEEVVAIGSFGVLKYIPRQYYLESIPKNGFFREGDYIFNVKPGNSKNEVKVKGWLRLTTGNSNTLNIDWIEDLITNQHN